MESWRQTLTTWWHGRPVAEAPVAGSRLLRASLGLEQFVRILGEVEHPAVLDLGRVWQSTVAFFTRLNCKLCAEDLFTPLQQALLETAPEAPPLRERFLPAVLQYPEGSLRGILAWDLFDYLPEELVEPLAARIYALLEPGGALLALFHNRLDGSPFMRYRVIDQRTFEVVSGSLPLSLQRAYANRALVNLFTAFRSSRTLVGRDNLRELFLLK